MAISRIACPSCGDPRAWQEVSTVTIFVSMDDLAEGKDGQLIQNVPKQNLEPETVDYDVHDRHVIGLRCGACDWQCEGTVEEWSKRLFPKLDAEALLETRRRLNP